VTVGDSTFGQIVGRKFHGDAIARKHVVHVIFAADLSHRSLHDVETKDAAIKGARLFSVDELEDVMLHPPIKRFLSRWQPGDPAVYLGALWAR